MKLFRIIQSHSQWVVNLWLNRTQTINPPAMISKEFIVNYIISCLSSGKRGKPCSDIVAVVKAILYRLKTGCQWRELPMQQFATTKVLTYQAVYYHFRRWVEDGSFRKTWVSILSKYKHYLDLSNINLDGSLTCALNGGEAVGFQERISHAREQICCF